MPYIKGLARPQIDLAVSDIANDVYRQPGALNYAITKLVQAFLGEDENYASFATATGVLENVKQEMYRRLVAPYEDRKRAENGDVY